MESLMGERESVRRVAAGWRSRVRALDAGFGRGSQIRS
jgi:hypothetical protein